MRQGAFRQDGDAPPQLDLRAEPGPNSRWARNLMASFRAIAAPLGLRGVQGPAVPIQRFVTPNVALCPHAVGTGQTRSDFSHPYVAYDWVPATGYR